MNDRLSIWIAFACSLAVSVGIAQESEQLVDYTKQVKPILSDNCYTCHGFDEAQRSTGLRLDDEASAFSDLGGYRAIVPGDVKRSELIRRIFSDDEDELMPPKGHVKSLTLQQKETLKKWIEQGAKWSSHWSFERPGQPIVPGVEREEWLANYIDRYILEKLEANGIEPSGPAEPHTLLRRLSFDLLGLPIDPSMVAQFENGELEYEEVVERMLISEHFGERMAVYWLDLVRYADTVGYHGDQDVSVTPYRDYVINAFNDNKPFDQFTIEQLAGDLLENPTQEQLIASGYNRLGMMSAEGGVQPEEYLAKYAADRVRTTASVWLGVTLGCAECHDHKFDPFSTKEFYEFAAFFADIKERGLYAGANRDGQWGPMIDVPAPELKGLLQPLESELARQQELMIETDTIRDSRIRWEENLAASTTSWSVLKPVAVHASGNSTHQVLDDQSILIGGERPDTATYVVVLDGVPSNSRGLRLEALPDPSLPQKGPGRAGNGNFVVSEIVVLPGNLVSESNRLSKAFGDWPKELKQKSIPLENASATVEQLVGGQSHPDKKWSASSAIDRDKKGKTWGWAILPDAGKPSGWVAQIKDGVDLGESQPVTVVIQQNHGHGSHTLGRFRLSATEDAGAVVDPVNSLPKAIQPIVRQAVEDRTEKQVKQLSDYYLTIAPELAATRKRIAELKTKIEKLKSEYTRKTLVTVSVAPREIRVLKRGDWMDKTGMVVQPGVPAALGEKVWDKRADRKDLAHWLVDPENPIVARVFVNRLWKLYFGQGLSSVLDDLGSQGEPPSHPELLDHLAWQLVQSGWDVKQLIRTIVTSQTYRQSSGIRVDLKEIDPENRLYARQSRFRLDAEFVRDNALAVSGLLDPTIGGRNGKPYQPVGLYRHLNFPKRKYQSATGRFQYRRGVYTHWQRQFLHPAMKTFDAPAREECTAARPRSSTPLAALVLLNDPSYVEAARVFATDVMAASGDQSERLNYLFQTSLAREPTAEEVDVLSNLLKEHINFYSENPEKAKSLLDVGLRKATGDDPVEELAAWTSVCRAVMNMHEFILRK